MKQKHVTKLARVAAFAVATVMMAMGGSAAEQDEMPDMEHSGMAMPMKEEGMMAMHGTMHAKMQAMDQELDVLVVEMNSADAQEKADAVAAVVSELVHQRKAMHAMMMEMAPKMMGHMMEHMSAGMTEGMKQSMGDCPMMQQLSSTDEQAEEEDHSAHHPED